MLSSYRRVGQETWSWSAATQTSLRVERQELADIYTTTTTARNHVLRSHSFSFQSFQCRSYPLFFLNFLAHRFFRPCASSPQSNRPQYEIENHGSIANEVIPGTRVIKVNFACGLGVLKCIVIVDLTFDKSAEKSNRRFVNCDLPTFSKKNLNIR